MTEPEPSPSRRRTRTALFALLVAVATAVTGMVTVVTAAPAGAAIKSEKVAFSAYDGCGLLPCSQEQLDLVYRKARAKAYTAMRTYQKDYAAICAVRKESKHVDIFPGSSAPGYRWTLDTVCGKRADVGTKIAIEPVQGGFRVVISPAELRTVAIYGGAVTTLLVAKVCGAIPEPRLRDICTVAGGTLSTWLAQQAAGAANRGCSAVVEVKPPRVRPYLRCP